VVVFSEEVQCLVALNASAAVLVRKLQSGMSAAEVADALVSEGIVTQDEAVSWVAATLEALADHGILAGSQPAAVPQTRIPVESPDTLEMPPYAPFKAKVERHYKLLNTCVLIRFALSDQARMVDSVIGHLATENDCAPSTVIDIRGYNDGNIHSYVYHDGKPIGRTSRLSHLAPIVKSELWQTAINSYQFLFYVHAGVVGNGDSCVLLPAAPGSGKSSLTAALTHRGHRYFSDEVALVEPETFRVAPMPLALCVKSSGWELIAGYYPEILHRPAHRRNDGKMVRYLPPPAAALQQKSSPVSHIIFPRYDPDVETTLSPVGRPEALRRLMEECLAMRRRLTAADAHGLVRWMETIHCYELSFSSLQEATDLVSTAINPATVSKN